MRPTSRVCTRTLLAPVSIIGSTGTPGKCFAAICFAVPNTKGVSGGGGGVGAGGVRHGVVCGRRHVAASGAVPQHVHRRESRKLANTTINRDGTVTAVSVAKGEELLTWYGASYGQSYDEVSADCVCVSCLDQMLGRNGPSRNRTRSSRNRTVLVRRYRLVELQPL